MDTFTVRIFNLPDYFHSMVEVAAVLSKLKMFGSEENLVGMKRFGIRGERIYGVSVKKLREMAKQIGSDHGLAIGLWNSGVHEARILATMIDDPGLIRLQQIENWVSQVDSWDLCDQLCGNLLVDSQTARDRIQWWIKSDKQFVKRVGFVLMAEMSVRDKKSDNNLFIGYLDLIARSEPDERNFVKKAVNWALRQIGKRNCELNKIAIGTAGIMVRSGAGSTRWIASGALRELKSEAVQHRLSRKKGDNHFHE